MNTKYFSQLNEANTHPCHRASEQQIRGFGSYFPAATSAGQLQDHHFLLLRLNNVTLQVFFEEHFPRRFERVFRRRRAKVRALDSSACTQCTDLLGCICRVYSSGGGGGEASPPNMSASPPRERVLTKSGIC